MPTILGANSVSGYQVSNSIRFNSGDNPKLERTLVAATGEKVKEPVATSILLFPDGGVVKLAL